MSELKTKICELISLSGPMRVSTFMTLALSDPENGYYKTAKPFGKDGDFITAPEISQMFGELIGVWVIESWQALKQPSSFILCELGPGRGTLMQDLLRTLKTLSPDTYHAANVFMVETSQKLADQQQQTLSTHGNKIDWVDDFSAVGKGPLLVIANEFLDALPIDQFIKVDGNWHERLIATDDKDNLIFITGDNLLDKTYLPQKYLDLPDGSILELAPMRLHFVANVLEQLKTSKGSALFIDYGSAGLPFGDTLQAVSKHEFTNIFASPGNDDLTSHVDFSSLQVIAKQQGILSAMLTQGEFLIRMGLLERAGKLGANKSSAIQENIRNEVERLAGENQMGQLFKVLGFSDKETGLHPVFTKDATNHN